MTKKQKLELTWIGKGERPRLEPRILIEDPELSYHAKARVSEGDIFDNRLIMGDNLLALKALEQDFAGKVKCVYIDPPFNTGSAFDHYDDGVEHSIWLNLMYARLNILKIMMRDDGVIAVHLDDCEAAYAKIFMDEIFGRNNYCNTITLTTNDPSGFKATGATVFSTANYILLYAKDKTQKPLKKLFIPKGYDTGYNKYLINPRSTNTSAWKWCGIAEIVAKELGFKTLADATKKLQESFDDEVADFALQNADRVFQLVAIGGGAAIKRRETISRSKNERERVFIHPNEDVPDFYIANGRQIVFYEKRLSVVDGQLTPAELITDVWTDISWNGIGPEGGFDFKNGKITEALIQRVVEMCTSSGDLVLDSFGGSGTTGAVSHNMGRRWIMIEMGNQCQSHIMPRLQRVIDVDDESGITSTIGWKGGGGFRFYRLAPSLLEKVRWDNWVIAQTYNPTMVAEAVCKLMGFTYAPSDQHYWLHGKSSETDFIYVTTQCLTHEQLRAMSEEVGDDRSLLVCCKAFSSTILEAFPNLTVKKIPQTVLRRCEWGRDDYSLNVANLPPAPEEAEEPPKPAKAGKGKAKAAEPSLFDGKED